MAKKLKIYEANIEISFGQSSPLELVALNLDSYVTAKYCIMATPGNFKIIISAKIHLSHRNFGEVYEKFPKIMMTFSKFKTFTSI